MQEHHHTGFLTAIPTDLFGCIHFPCTVKKKKKRIRVGKKKKKRKRRKKTKKKKPSPANTK